MNPNNLINPFHRTNLIAPLLVLALFLVAPRAPAAFVYETPAEFLTSGDFNGDGVPDVLVLDRLTGNARVGYQTNGVLTWSAPLPTGVTSPDALAVGHFRDTNQDAIAITASELNRVHLLRLSDPVNPPVPALMTPSGVGPDLLAGLAAPYGTVSNFDSLVIGSSANNTNLGLTLLELFGFVGDALSAYQDSVAQQAYLARGNSLLLGADPQTYLAAIQRGSSNDTFVIFSPSNHFSMIASRPGLISGSDYVFGQFNGETLPRFIFYVPGQSNVLVQSLLPGNGNYVFDSGISVALAEAVQDVYYVNDGADGVAVLRFGDGVQGLTLPGGSATLSSTYRTGGGAAGNVFTGIVPLPAGDFALFDAPSGGAAAAHGQVVHFNGSTFTQVSSANLPAVTARGTRANVWLFQAEPFVSSDPGFISSVNDPDWASSTSLSSGSLGARTESDLGTVSGLGSPVTNNLGAVPTGAAYATPDQYRDFISLFTFSSPRPPEAVNITISPPAGLYGGPIQVAFSTLNAGDQVLFRLNPSADYQPYLGPFALTNDTTVQYYGSNGGSGARSRLYAAAYTFGRSGIETPQPPLELAPGSTNPAPLFQTNLVQLSDIGTVFYGRRGTNNQGTLWAINLDGSGETYITAGARPRVSRDGRYLAFLREGNPFNNQGNLWVRDLASGLETRVYSNATSLVCYDWDLTETNLVFDYNTTFWLTSLAGPATQFALSGNLNQGAPAVNPVDSRVAFHILYPGPTGLYIAPPDLSSKQLVPLGFFSPIWPAWSPDGQWLSFADDRDISPSVDSGRNLWVLQLDNTNLFQITGLTDNTNGFPHGALWSPDGDALVGAGTLFGTNGIWIIPLTPDHTDCAGAASLLPTSPGDPIDFVGSIVTAPGPLTVVEPGLFIRLDPDAAVVYWNSAYQGFTLESTTDLTPPAAWSVLPPPYDFDGVFYQYREPLSSLAQQKFFRLHYTGGGL